MKKVGIMGGTFDPIHFGHLFIANEVLNIYNMDKIIFIPTGNPPHKKGPSASASDRYIMTNIATQTNKNFLVSDIEVKSNEKSYTLNTLKELKEKHPDTEFYFITGTDAIIGLPTWHQPEQLLSMIKFIAVTRPGINSLDVEIKIKEIIDKYNAKIELLHVPLLQISSSIIRDRISKGISVKYLLPEEVENYIVKNNLYIENPINIEELKNKLKNNVNLKLYNHCVSTMNEAEKLALTYNIDTQKAKIAGLLHDCAKSKGVEGDNIRHAITGKEHARILYNIDDEEILNAIRYHTTGRENMNMLEKIIFIADKIEPGRNYEGVHELRELAYKNIDEAIIKSLNSTIEYVKKRNLELDIDSVRTLDYLKGGIN